MSRTVSKLPDSKPSWFKLMGHNQSCCQPNYHYQHIIIIIIIRGCMHSVMAAKQYNSRLYTQAAESKSSQMVN